MKRNEKWREGNKGRTQKGKTEREKAGKGDEEEKKEMTE